MDVLSLLIKLIAAVMNVLFYAYEALWYPLNWSRLKEHQKIEALLLWSAIFFICGVIAFAYFADRSV